MPLNKDMFDFFSDAQSAWKLPHMKTYRDLSTGIYVDLYGSLDGQFELWCGGPGVPYIPIVIVVQPHVFIPFLDRTNSLFRKGVYTPEGTGPLDSVLSRFRHGNDGAVVVETRRHYEDNRWIHYIEYKDGDYTLPVCILEDHKFPVRILEDHKSEGESDGVLRDCYLFDVGYIQNRAPSLHDKLHKMDQKERDQASATELFASQPAMLSFCVDYMREE